MTACAPEAIASDSRTARHSTFTIAADGAYAARLNASAEGGWFPERWTLDGPEPYAVPLPGARPEEPGSQVLPLADGRVLIARPGGGVQKLALLYPTGPATGELALGAVESERLTLLPPAPCGRRAYALTAGERSTGVWLVAGCGEAGPQLVAEVPGRCGGGAWLDREGRLLAIDRTDTGGTGRTKTVVVDLGRGGEVSPLLQITDESEDRLLLADADSGLLIVRSDAPGELRLGWGVLGSHRPVRFPEALHPEGARLTPFAVQPGQTLLPESCAVALHGQTTGARAGGAWLGVWRPMQKELRRFRAPGGWLPGKGVWTREGELRLPCATVHAPCGLARLRMRGSPPDAEAGATVAGTGTGESLGAGVDLSAAVADARTAGAGAPGAGAPGGGGSAEAGGAKGRGTSAGAGPFAGPGAGAEGHTGRHADGHAEEHGTEGGTSLGAAPECAPRTGAAAGAAGPDPCGTPAAGTGWTSQEGGVARPLPPAVPPGALPAEVPVVAGDGAEAALRPPDRMPGLMPDGRGAGRPEGGAGDRPVGSAPVGTAAETAPGRAPGAAAGPSLGGASGAASGTGAGTVMRTAAGSGPGAAGGPDAPPATGAAAAETPLAVEPLGANATATSTAATEANANAVADAAVETAADSPSPGVTEPCDRRRPVPLQDAPLASALHDAAVRARTA